MRPSVASGVGICSIALVLSLLTPEDTFDEGVKRLLARVSAQVAQ